MSAKGNLVFSSLVFFLFCTSCSNESDKGNKYVRENFSKYENEYSIIKDSVNMYTDSLLKDFVGEYMWKWRIDSLLFLDSKKEKLVATILISSGADKEAVSDEILKILGKKVNGRWFFFHGGGALIVPRDMYGASEMNPLSFGKLSQIARQEVMIGGLGDSVDSWINGHFEYNGMCAHCKTHAQFDSTHWQKITEKWKARIDTNEFKKKRTENF
jgi:hypothetical protein